MTIESAFQSLLSATTAVSVTLTEDNVKKARHTFFYGAWWAFDLVVRHRATRADLVTELHSLADTLEPPDGTIADFPSLAGGLVRWLNACLAAGAPETRRRVEAGLFLHGAHAALDQVEADAQGLLNEIGAYLSRPTT